MNADMHGLFPIESLKKWGLSKVESIGVKHTHTYTHTHREK